MSRHVIEIHKDRLSETSIVFGCSHFMTTESELGVTNMGESNDFSFRGRVIVEAVFPKDAPEIITIAYGLDHAIGYFLDVFYDPEDEPIVELYGKSRIGTFLVVSGLKRFIPEKHFSNIMMDLPLE